MMKSKGYACVTGYVKAGLFEWGGPGGKIMSNFKCILPHCIVFVVYIATLIYIVSKVFCLIVCKMYNG